MRKTEFEDMVECHYPNGVIALVPKRIMDRVAFLVEHPEREYVDYKEGARMYSMSERKFFDFVKRTDAKRKVDDKVLINVKELNDFLERFCRAD